MSNGKLKADKNDLLMGNDDAVELLKDIGIRVTPNRILVLRAIMRSSSPLSLAELEQKLLSLERSSVFRVLVLFLRHGVVHTVEDGRGIVRYELCTGHGPCTGDDLHVHFYCEICGQVSCFENVHIPAVILPEGFAVHSVNYMAKGICPRCSRKKG